MPVIKHHVVVLGKEDGSLQLIEPHTTITSRSMYVCWARNLDINWWSQKHSWVWTSLVTTRTCSEVCLLTSRTLVHHQLIQHQDLPATKTRWNRQRWRSIASDWTPLCSATSCALVWKWDCQWSEIATIEHTFDFGAQQLHANVWTLGGGGGWYALDWVDDRLRDMVR